MTSRGDENPCQVRLELDMIQARILKQAKQGQENILFIIFTPVYWAWIFRDFDLLGSVIWSVLYLLLSSFY